MYSKIPMPQFKWNDDDMKYMLVFFPWIGAVIGLLLMLWKYIYSHFGVADICYVCIGALIPMAVTGGFHIDGFMDNASKDLNDSMLMVFMKHGSER
jgi:adenosylcobinamide-GDP ribazoletransferase